MYSVVLVEDDPILRTTYSHFLEEAGVEVSTARNADEAYRLCESSHPDLIIACMHLRAKGMSERPLIYVLHEAFPEVPVLAMATSKNEMMITQARRMGAVGLMRRSSDGNHLVRVTGSIIGASIRIRQRDLLMHATPIASATAG